MRKRPVRIQRGCARCACQRRADLCAGAPAADRPHGGRPLDRSALGAAAAAHTTRAAPPSRRARPQGARATPHRGCFRAQDGQDSPCESETTVKRDPEARPVNFVPPANQGAPPRRPWRLGSQGRPPRPASPSAEAVARVNAMRAANGIPGDLVEDPALSAGCRAHAHDASSTAALTGVRRTTRRRPGRAIRRTAPPSARPQSGPLSARERA